MMPGARAASVKVRAKLRGRDGAAKERASASYTMIRVLSSDERGIAAARVVAALASLEHLPRAWMDLV